MRRLWRRFSGSRLWRAWKRYGDRRGDRLAGATTFFGFLSMFPLIVLAVAVTSSLLDQKAVDELEDGLRKNLPGIADKIDIDGLIAHAGTIGWISAVTLLFTGLGWVDALRASIRSMHELDDEPGNLLQRKLTDLIALAGLGVTGMLATGTASLVTSLSDRIVDWVGLDGTWIANWGLDALGYLLGVFSGAVLFLYIQAGLPRIRLPRRVALQAALAGGLVFLGAQKLGSLYVNYVLGNNQAYGALALPLALLVWIYLMTRLIMLIAAWSAEATHDLQTIEDRDLAAAEASLLGGLGVAPQKTRRVVPIPDRKADPVAVAAGAVLGATATAFAVTVARATRTVLGALRR